MEDYYLALVDTLPPIARLSYNKTKHARVETGFVGRRFVMYQMVQGTPVILDEFEVQAYDCDEGAGAVVTIRSLDTDKSIKVGYTPVQLGDAHVFISHVLQGRVRWAGASIDQGSLAFPLLVRTPFRTGMREGGTTALETSVDFYQEFDDINFAEL